MMRRIFSLYLVVVLLYSCGVRTRPVAEVTSIELEFEKLIEEPDVYDSHQVMVKGFLMTTAPYPMALFSNSEIPSFHETLYMPGILIDDSNLLRWHLDNPVEVYIEGVFSKPDDPGGSYGSLSAIKRVRLLAPSTDRVFGSGAVF